MAPKNQISFLHVGEPTFEIFGLSLPSLTSIFILAFLLIPFVLGWIARRNPMSVAILFVAVLTLLALEHGRWWSSFLSGDVGRREFYLNLRPAEIAAFVGCFVLGIGAKFLAQRRSRIATRTSDSLMS